MEGKLVRLRAYEKSDLDNVMLWVNDEEVTRFLGPHLAHPVSRTAEERFLEAAASVSPNDKVFAIETLAGEYIGGIDIRGIDWIERRGEVGIVIGVKQFWGKGYGEDSMRVLMRLAFEKLGLNRLSLRVLDFNQRAIACYEKCGFKREGVLREDHFAEGRFHDVIV